MGTKNNQSRKQIGSLTKELKKKWGESKEKEVKGEKDGGLGRGEERMRRVRLRTERQRRGEGRWEEGGKEGR